MKKTLFAVSAATLLTATAAFAGDSAMKAGYATGDTVENMTVTDSNGVVHNLADFKGQTVVLEWTNDGCPYVQKHYETDNMQALQKEASAQDVVWLSVISSAPGKQGHVDGEGANALTADRDAAPAAVILDETGVAGKTFAAKTTPHMYIIDADQTLVYQGAIDDNPSSNPATVASATNYVSKALTEVLAGEAVTMDTTKPYGCSVKYGS